MTAYTEAERQEIVAALKACKQFLWDGVGRGRRRREEYICIALERTNLPTGLTHKLIRERLGLGTSSLHTWLVTRGVDPKDITQERMQAHRLAWVDKLIEEFSA